MVHDRNRIMLHYLNKCRSAPLTADPRSYKLFVAFPLVFAVGKFCGTFSEVIGNERMYSISMLFVILILISSVWIVFGTDCYSLSRTNEWCLIYIDTCPIVARFIFIIF